MKIVYGPKGTGKTKIVIADANAQVDSAKGHVVFITDTNRYMYDLKYQIRFIDVKGYEIKLSLIHIFISYCTPPHPPRITITVRT